jgi:heavy metal sensor kinase
MAGKRDLRRLTRGLRFRLTATYALFFTVLLASVAAYFRASLVRSLDLQVHEILDKDWAAMKGYLRIDRDPDIGKNASNWYYAEDDPEEATIVGDIKKIYMIADEEGTLVHDAKTQEPEYSTIYDEIGIDPPALVKQRVREAVQAMSTQKPGTPGKTWWDYRHNSRGERFLIRSGIVLDEGHLAPGRHLPYYVAIGAPLADSDKILRSFTWRYIGIIPAALILGSILGWIMTGRVLTPVKEVARTAQRITGSNLSLRIPPRQSGDELDYLILTFNRMIERLQASFQQMRQFSTDVSHELRTPITAIRGQLEVALFTAKTTDQYREAMFNALQDIDRLSQIVRALLLLSQAESGQLVLQKARLNLSELLKDLVEQFQIPAEEAGIHLSANLPAECPGEVDRVQIERMITNLLSNALKFTPRGGSVRMTLERLSDRLELVVEDTGRGIATEHLPYIFDRFYRVPGTGSAPSPEQGLGLGLSFVAWIVKAHRGKIAVDSSPGKGTRFTISLPVEGVGSETLELTGQPASLA